MRPQSPCLNCENRSVGCHAYCDEYITYSYERKDFNKKVSKMKKSETYTITHSKNTCGQK